VLRHWRLLLDSPPGEWICYSYNLTTYLQPNFLHRHPLFQRQPEHSWHHLLSISDRHHFHNKRYTKWLKCTYKEQFGFSYSCLLEFCRLWKSKQLQSTRKQSYRKDYRVMHPIYGCPENFWESLSMPTATFPEIFNGFSFRSILWMCVQNLKSVALPVPEIIRGTLKLWAIPGYAHAPFSPKFLTGFCSDGHSECSGQIWSP